MSDKNAFGFGAFVPGFDFLQGLVQSAAQGSPQTAPDWSKWVAPTLQAEEIEKRVNELKTVQFWLEQNARALAATIQALEVQKMTLATLRGMNVQVNDLASAFGFGKGGSAAAPAPAPASGTGPYDDMFTHRAAERPAAPPAVAPEPAEAQSAEPRPADASAAPPAVDPLQWWNALAGQFQQIAAGAMQEAAAQARQNPAGLQGAALQAFDAAGRMAADVVAAAVPTAKRPARKAAAGKKPAAATPKPAARAAAKTARPAGKAVKKAAATPQAAVRRKR